MIETKAPPLGCYQRFSYGVISTTEAFFYSLGKCIANNPLRTILFCWAFVFIAALGFFRFYQERNPLGLWVPANSQFKKDSEWLMSTLETAYRIETAIIVADDVLTPEVIRNMYDIDQRVRNVVSSMGYIYEDVCFKIPEIDSSLMELLYPPRYQSRKKQRKLGGISDSNVRNSTNVILREDNEEDVFDPSVEFDQDTYCNFVEAMDIVCYGQTILDLWGRSERKIRKLTKEKIIERINTMKQDPILKNLKNFEALLGDVTRNETGHIIAARALRTSWMTHLNFTAVVMDDVGNYAGTTEWGSAECLDWELSFLNVMEETFQEMKKNGGNVSITYAAARSYGDISGYSMFQGIENLFAGSVIMLIYVQFVISKFNWVEMRAVLGGVGLLSVVMALIASCGICSLVGIPYGPVHTSLPFLLLGLGVDDMFVIVACWDQVSSAERKQPLPERVGIMLRHAGVSITVTTATDVLAFVVGSTTVLPSLQSYCLYTAVGVLLTFIFVVTFFIACFTIDQKRLENNRNGVFPWIKHENYKPNKFSQAGTSHRVFKTIYSKVILTWPGKLIVLALTLGCLGLSIEGCLKLEQKFDPIWFVPDQSYLGQFIKAKTELYPTYGFEAGTYVGNVNYTHEFRNLKEMGLQLDNCTDIISNNVIWTGPFREYVLKIYKIDIYEEELTDAQFNTYLSRFLFSSKGIRFQANFKFATPLICGKPAPRIQLSSFEYIFRPFAGPQEHVPAMRRVIRLSKELNLTTGDQFATAWSNIFASWITDEIIDAEVIRNIQLALFAVMVCTSLLIANVQICFWVFVMIILSMVNVCGFMQRWGLTIDIVSCVGLQLAIGLCVDYATHIGHKFLTIDGKERQERVIKTVTSMGSAVLYGGCSTLISVTMLGFSDSYNFKTFFKIFLLVIVFGLFHGIVLLPVILSIVGPKPYFQRKSEQIGALDVAETSDMIEAQEIKPSSENNVIN